MHGYRQFDWILSRTRVRYGAYLGSAVSRRIGSAWVALGPCVSGAAETQPEGKSDARMMKQRRLRRVDDATSNPPEQDDFCDAMRLTSGALRGLASSRPEPQVLEAQASREASRGPV
jgi:hypothetical protein